MISNCLWKAQNLTVINIQVLSFYYQIILINTSKCQQLWHRHHIPMTPCPPPIYLNTKGTLHEKCTALTALTLRTIELTAHGLCTQLLGGLHTATIYMHRSLGWKEMWGCRWNSPHRGTFRGKAGLTPLCAELDVVSALFFMLKPCEHTFRHGFHTDFITAQIPCPITRQKTAVWTQPYSVLVNPAAYTRKSPK